MTNGTAIVASDIRWTLSPSPPATASDADDLLVEVILDSQSYRALACAALHHCHQVTVDLQRVRAWYREVLDESRRFREGVLRRADAESTR